MALNGLSRVLSAVAGFFAPATREPSPGRLQVAFQQRVREPRILRTTAVAIVEQVRSMSHCSPERHGLLQCLAATLQMSLDPEQSWMDSVDNGNISTREALASRARKLIQASATEHSLSLGWRQHESALRLMWDGLVKPPRSASPRRALAGASAALVQNRAASRGRRRSPSNRSRTPTDGAACSYADTPPLGSEFVPPATWIPQWHPAEVVLTRTVANGLPKRRMAPAPTDEQQRRQQRVVQTWQLQRLTDAERQGIFAHGELADAIRSWRQQTERRTKRAAPSMPPMHVLRSAIRVVTAPTPLRSTGGQLWSALDGLPLDAAQVAAVMGVPMVWQEALLALAEKPSGPSAAQMRQLLGSSVHWDSATLALNRGLRKLQRAPRTFAASGAGLNILGAALWELRRRKIAYVWYAECDETTRKAHDALWTAMGAAPRRVARAEATMGVRLPQAEVELITLRCAPFSPKNRSFPRGVWAAVAELTAVLQAVFARSPKLIVYENTAGVLRKAWLRAAIEQTLAGDVRYDWELMVAMPERQSNAMCSRRRAYYIGVLRTAAKSG